MNEIISIIVIIALIWLVVYICNKNVLIAIKLNNIITMFSENKIMEKYLKKSKEVSELAGDKAAKLITKGDQKEQIKRGIIFVTIGIVVILIPALLK